MTLRWNCSRPVFVFYRGENLLLEIKVGPLHFEWWHRDARPN